MLRTKSTIHGLQLDPPAAALLACCVLLSAVLCGNSLPRLPCAALQQRTGFQTTYGALAGGLPALLLLLLHI